MEGGEIMVEFLKKLVTEGSRVFWTVIEGVAGIAAAYNVPETLFDFAGEYEAFIVGADGVGVMALATFLKEVARKRLSQ